ncbi:hypothetical protein QCA50_021199 [Cerrena zonata]|uniref:P-loop containing nucleoside triphosphate hydrolase protein n=1 Tax=Cerrena zonata TaxID=2478898 RepID=A0AAW0FF38_9APHY
MDNLAVELAEYLVDRLTQKQDDQRLLVGIAGVPASGKSTLCQIIINHVNRKWQQKHNIPEVAVVVGLDGWHFTRAQLDAMPDPKLAHDRRGAHWTFDGESYTDFMRELQKVPSSTAIPLTSVNIVHAPSFSHELKDPTPRAVAIHPYHRLVVVEGLYTFLGIPPWNEAGEMLDERWWVEIGEEEAEKRLVLRHVKSGVAKDLLEALWRARENDAPNGRFVKENMLKPTRVIHSVEDPVLQH